MLIVLVLVLVLVLAVGLGGALAGAKKKWKAHTWGSRITLQHPSATRFAGTVDSKLAACFKSRLVNLFYTDSTGNTALVSVQRTDGNGRYEINLTQAAYPGVYQAKAGQERIRARKAPQICQAADSPIFGI